MRLIHATSQMSSGTDRRLPHRKQMTTRLQQCPNMILQLLQIPTCKSSVNTERTKHHDPCFCSNFAAYSIRIIPSSGFLGHRFCDHSSGLGSRPTRCPPPYNRVRRAPMLEATDQFSCSRLSFVGRLGFRGLYQLLYETRGRRW